MLLPDSDRVLAPGEQPTQYLIERQECANGSDIQGTGVDAERGIAVTFTLNSRGTRTLPTVPATTSVSGWRSCSTAR